MSDDLPENPLAIEIPNASDPKRLARQRDQAKREEGEARVFWRALFASVVGRREIWRLLDMGHPFEFRFSIDGTREKTWILAGEQHLAAKQWRALEAHDFDGMTQMRRENDPTLRK